VKGAGLGFLGLLAVSMTQDGEYPMSFLEQATIVAIPAFLEGWWRSKHIKQEADEARLTQQMKDTE
jgi:hypothetical protein